MHAIKFPTLLNCIHIYKHVALGFTREQRALVEDLLLRNYAEERGTGGRVCGMACTRLGCQSRDAEDSSEKAKGGWQTMKRACAQTSRFTSHSSARHTPTPRRVYI